MKANKKTDSPIRLDFGKDITKVYLSDESEDEVQCEEVKCAKILPSTIIVDPGKAMVKPDYMDREANSYFADEFEDDIRPEEMPPIEFPSDVILVDPGWAMVKPGYMDREANTYLDVESEGDIQQEEN